MATVRYGEIVSQLAQDIGVGSKTAAEKIALVEELKAEREAVISAERSAGASVLSDNTKPDYANLFTIMANETDPDVYLKLRTEAYTFVAPLTQEEKDLFNYLPSDYIENNPGYNEDGEWVSFIGSFPNPETGEYS